MVSTDATRGVPYALPQLQYEVKLTRTLAQCEQALPVKAPVLKKGKKPAAAPTVDAIKIVMKAEATPAIVAGERYDLDYEALAGLTKISSTSIDYYESGTVKSINAAAEDRTAAIVGETAKAAFSVARIAAGIPGGNAAPAIETARQMLVCTDAAKTLLGDVKTKTADLKIANEELEGRTERVTKLTEQLKLGTLNEAGKAKLAAAIAAQTEQAKTVADTQGALEKAIGKVTVTTAERLTADPADPSGFLKLTGVNLVKITALVERKPLVDGPNAVNECNLEVLAECVASQVQAVWALERLVPLPATRLESGSPGAIKSTTAQKGIFVRPPEAGRLRICRDGDPNADCDAGSRELLLTSADTMIPQLGQLRFLPFRNRVFQNNSLVLSLRENGGIEKFEYKNLSAQAETAAKMAADLASQGLTFADSRRKDRTDDAAAAVAAGKTDRESQLALLQFQIELMTKQRDLDKLGNTDVAVLQQQIELLSKQKELDKLSQPASVSELDTIKADAELAAARTALYEAILAERKAKAALQE